MLKECLTSLRVENVFIALVGPKSLRKSPLIELADVVFDDGNASLPSAINLAVSQLPKHIQYVSWLGDDDQIVTGAIRLQEELMEESVSVVATYGQCRYIDLEGNELGVQKSGKFAISLLRWGPNLVPQPGGLFRRETWIELEGLDENYSQAFDTDFYLRIRKKGEVRYLPQILANYRWHDQALSVGNRWKSVLESSRARKRNSSNPFITNFVLDWFVRLATLMAGRALSFSLSRRRRKS